MITMSNVYDVLLRNMERNADPILEFMRRNDGKPFTKVSLRKLRESLVGTEWGNEEWLIVHVGSCLTNLQTKSYAQSRGNKGVSFLLSYDTKNVRIDSHFFEEKNTCYFKARRERNEQRLVAMNDRAKLEKMANALNKVIQCKAVFELAKSELEDLTSYGEAFSADRFDWESACGLRS